MLRFILLVGTELVYSLIGLSFVKYEEGYNNYLDDNLSNKYCMCMNFNGIGIIKQSLINTFFFNLKNPKT